MLPLVHLVRLFGSGSRTMVGSGVVSGTKIAAGSGSMSVVCSGICSVQGVGGGWMGSVSRVVLVMSSSVGQTVKGLFTIHQNPRMSLKDHRWAGVP